MSQDPSLYSPPKERKPTRPTFKPGSRAAPIPEGATLGFQKASAIALVAGARDGDAVEDSTLEDGTTMFSGLGAFAYDAAVAGAAEPKSKLEKVKKQPCIDLLKDESLKHDSGYVNVAKDDAIATDAKQKRKKTAKPLLDEIEDEHSKCGPADNHDAEPGAPEDTDKSKKKPAKRKDGIKLDKKPTARQPRKKDVDKHGDTTETKMPTKRAKPKAAILEKPTIAEAAVPTKFVFKAFRLPGSLATQDTNTPQAVEEDPPKPIVDADPKPIETEVLVHAAHAPMDALPNDHAPSVDKTAIDAAPRVSVVDFQACYAYNDSAARSHDEEPVAKRPRLDLEQVSFKKPTIPVTLARSKSPPKKPLTITALAISRAKQTGEDVETIIDANDDVRKRDIRALGFKLDPPNLAESEKQEAAEPEAKRKRKKKAAKPEPPKPRKLPSPRSAMKRMEALDLMFGTSSQIKAEDTQYLLDLQEAVRASETESQAMHEVSITEALPAGDRPGRKLWSVSARDEEELLLLPESPEQRQRERQLLRDEEAAAKQQAGDKSNEATKAEPEDLAPPNDEFLDIDAVEVASEAAKPMARLKLPTSKLKSCLKSTSSIMAGGSAGVLTPISPNKPTVMRGYSTTAGKVADKGLAVTSSNDQENTLPTWNTHGIEKPKVSRKKKSVQTPTESELISANSEAKPAQKKRGRPKKDTSAVKADEAPSTPTKKRPVKRKKAEITVDEYQAIEDIEDDVAPSPSPPRRTSPSKLAELEMSQSTSQAVAEANQDKTAEEEAHRQVLEALRLAEEAEAKLFAEITRTVKSEPRTADLKNPSWFEKILLYDPIVLEDLTAWLNKQELRTASDGKELKATLVQKWCESNSICCLWREGLRGGVKKRY